jgi:T4 RnlA family RNA ligase
MLHKFYNLNQIPQTNIEIIKHKNIKNISTKMDGSLIGFFQLPNKKVYPMTKGSFTNEVIDQVNNYLKKNVQIINFIENMFDKGFYPLFEWVSPKNQIVLHYNEESLTLLQIRDENGKYLNLDYFDDLIKKYNIEKTKYWNLDNIDELLDLRENIKNFEGWVIQFDDDCFVKLKTDEYFELHKTLSSLNLKTIFELIINNDLDDYKDRLTENGNMFVPYKKSVILKIEENIQNHIFKTIKDIENILLEDIDLSAKEFALKYLKHSYFGLLMKLKRDVSLNKFELLKEFLLKKYRTNSSVEEFLENLVQK